MNTRTRSASTELMQQVKKILHHNPKLSLRCVKCDSIFPKEYKKCPHCHSYQT
ncbi:MAG: hypothetical protein OEM21_01205 [Nitrosopumilus sp.]|nr:hypothetical protein [Nitrosopumilus sp.]